MVYADLNIFFWNSKYHAGRHKAFKTVEASKKV